MLEASHHRLALQMVHHCHCHRASRLVDFEESATKHCWSFTPHSACFDWNHWISYLESLLNADSSWVNWKWSAICNHLWCMTFDQYWARSCFGRPAPLYIPWRRSWIFSDSSASTASWTGCWIGLCLLELPLTLSICIDRFASPYLKYWNWIFAAGAPAFVPFWAKLGSMAWRHHQDHHFFSSIFVSRQLVSVQNCLFEIDSVCAPWSHYQLRKVSISNRLLRHHLVHLDLASFLVSRQQRWC